MERRDYLETQIQQLGRFLRLLTEKLLGKSSSPDQEQISQIKNEFEEKAGFNMELLASPEFEILKGKLLSTSSFNAENIEILADYMIILADTNGKFPVTEMIRLRHNALKLYEWLDIREKTYSVERQIKMEEVRNSLK